MEEIRIIIFPLVTFFFPCFSQDFLMVDFFYEIKMQVNIYVMIKKKKVDIISPGEISKIVNYNYSLLGGMFIWNEQVDWFLPGVTSQSLTVAASWKWSLLHQLGAGQTVHTPLEMVRYTSSVAVVLQGKLYWSCSLLSGCLSSLSSISLWKETLQNITQFYKI